MIMSRLILSAVGLGLMLTSPIGYGASGDNSNEVQKAFDQWRQIASEVSDNPTEEGVLKLGQGLRKLERASVYPSEERFEVQKHIRRALQTIPNHAEYFSGALERAIQAEFAEARDAATTVRVQPDRGQIYLTLAQLPSPQVVGLLGELLYDERDPWKDEPKIDRRPRPNSFYATQTLNRLGLDGVQIIELKTTRDNEAALHQWKLWYEQVKAGNRRFRFQGDPQEYTLAGPVVEAREPTTTRPAPEIASENVSAASKEAENKATGLPIWPLTLAGVLLVVAIWFATKRKPAAS
jgi:hypothetical protein